TVEGPVSDAASGAVMHLIPMSSSSKAEDPVLRDGFVHPPKPRRTGSSAFAGHYGHLDTSDVWIQVFQFGLCSSISLIFQARFHFFSRFSRLIAFSGSSNCSK